MKHICLLSTVRFSSKIIYPKYNGLIIIIWLKIKAIDTITTTGYPSYKQITNNRRIAYGSNDSKRGIHDER